MRILIGSGTPNEGARFHLVFGVHFISRGRDCVSRAVGYCGCSEKLAPKVVAVKAAVAWQLVSCHGTRSLASRLVNLTLRTMQRS